MKLVREALEGVVREEEAVGALYLDRGRSQASWGREGPQRGWDSGAIQMKGKVTVRRVCVCVCVCVRVKERERESVLGQDKQRTSL